MNVMTIIGTRPQYVKAAAVSHVLRNSHREILIDTGQHYDDRMAGAFWRDLNLPRPDVQLGVGSAGHAVQIARMLEGIEAALVRHRPDLVLVYGDTNSTLAGALAAATLGVPVAHVEAGCRSYDRSMPEEINRVVTDHLSTIACCATARNREALAREGITVGVSVVGDVMLDLLQRYEPSLPVDEVLAEYGVHSRAYLLLTIHRAANTDDLDRLRTILSALAGAGEPILFPIHPRTRQRLQGAGCGVPAPVVAIDPVGYREMLALTSRARLVLTDSGGVQKEAFFLGAPCVTLRDRTEWTETVDEGWNRLVDADPVRIREALAFSGGSRPPRRTLFGDGRAADHIVDALARATDGVAL